MVLKNFLTQHTLLLPNIEDQTRAKSLVIESEVITSLSQILGLTSKILRNFFQRINEKIRKVVRARQPKKFIR